MWQWGAYERNCSKILLIAGLDHVWAWPDNPWLCILVRFAGHFTEQIQMYQWSAIMLDGNFRKASKSNDFFKVARDLWDDPYIHTYMKSM